MNVKLEVIDTECIWDKAPHNAFTDLIRFNDSFYCAFREGSSHMSLDGTIRILRSIDGKNWSSFQEIRWQGGDLRDPKLSITPSKQLLITAGIRLAVPSKILEKLLSVSWLIDKKELTGPYLCDTSYGTWRWGPTWHNDQVYSIGYAGRDLQGCLYQSVDGKDWLAHKAPFFPEAECFSNESSLVFSNSDVAYCLLRRDGQDANALLGQASPPYLNWKWTELELSIGGPKMIMLQNGSLVAAVRVINDAGDDARTVLYHIKPDGHLTLLCELVSGGDTSYAGMVEFNNHLWISYYSSHEEKSAIYFAKVKII